MITEKGFDSEKYLKLQSEHISERISKFGKLYLEFGGKLFDDFLNDYHLNYFIFYF